MAVRPALDRIGELLPRVRMRRDEIEAARCLPGDVASELRETGVFSLSVPRVLGGQEAHPAEILDVIETVSAADGSTGWCTMVGIANNVAAGYMSESGAREVFADPDVPSAGIAAPAGAAARVDGGVLVRGRWQFASGITHSDWVWAGCMVMENGRPRMTADGPEIIHVCLPVKDVQIHDTWFVSGLSGTGSRDFSIEDAFVPEDRIFLLLDPSGHRQEPLYQLPPFGWFVSQAVTVSIGIARAALDEIAELAQSRIPSMSRDVLADRPVAQIEVARAEAQLGSARAYLYETVAELWDVVTAGGQPTPRQFASNRIACANAAETAATVTRTVSVLAGGSAVFASSSLHRHSRDADALAHHFSVSPHTWEDAGRVLLGRPPASVAF